MPTPPHDGHRQRLRQTFADQPADLTATELLELLLTFAIPRRDVAPLAQALLDRFESISGVLSAPANDLIEMDGIGDAAGTLIPLVGYLAAMVENEKRSVEDDLNRMSKKVSTVEPQQPLFALAETQEVQEEPSVLPTYANDEVANALLMIPQAANFASLEAFRAFLVDKLPYNSVSTRERRSQYILNRFYPDGRIDIPLTYFAAHCSSDDLKPVLFYHILKSEPMVAKVAEDFVWAALPIGYILTIRAKSEPDRTVSRDNATSL